MPPPVFADTSGLMAQFLEGDPNHVRASAEALRLGRAGRRFLSTNYVFDELVTAVRHRGGFDASRRVAHAVRSSASLTWVFIDAGLETKAWNWYVKYHDHALSFTDAVSMAVMKEFGIAEAFTFDGDFAKAGFVKLPH